MTRWTDRAAQAWLRITWRVWVWRLARATRAPMRQQQRLLARILRTNKDTRFGRAHGFERIRGHADFIARVPVADYETLRPYVQSQIEHGEPALTAESPQHYLRTSGSTGLPKDIPATPRHLRQLRAWQRRSVAAQERLYPAAFAGALLAINSPAVEGRLGNGKPYGSASGLLVGGTPGALRGKFVLPAAVLAIDDALLRQQTILRLALARSDLTYIGTANPSTVLVLLRVYAAHAPQLLEDLRSGSFWRMNDLPVAVRRQLRSRLRADPARADTLATLHHQHDTVGLADLWPELKLVVTWTCASAGVAAQVLRSQLPAGARLHELGYIASEFRGTVTLGRRAGSGLPTYDTHFFEFVERGLWEQGQPRFLTLDELRKGAEYFVIVTTGSGLYRYFIDDIVRVTGFLHRMPLLEFRQKGRGVTSITGEKLYEAQVLTAVQRALAALDCQQRFAVMLADVAAAGYLLYVETDGLHHPPVAELAQAVDAQLQALNIEYHGKRHSGRLGKVAAHWLAPGTEGAYRADAVRRGQREGQFKPVALAYAGKFDFDLAPYVERS